MIAFLGLVVVAFGIIILAFPDLYWALNRSCWLGSTPDSGRIISGVAAISLGVALLVAFG